MSRPFRIPKYSLHKATGQARTVIRGKHFYLGAFGSPESREAYARLISEHSLAEKRSSGAPPPNSRFPDLTIAELLLRYLEFAQQYYRKNGNPTKELVCMREAMGHIRALYDRLPAQEFGPLKLKAVRRHMIEQCGLSRGVVNNRINRIKRIFKWAVSEELVPPSSYEGLRAVAGLKFGRSNARETKPIQPAQDDWVDAVLPYTSPQVGALIQLQRLTGMRPCEVVMMRPCDLDMSRDVWLYTPADHKNRWRGHQLLTAFESGGAGQPNLEALGW